MKIVLTAGAYALAAVGVAIATLALLGVDPGPGALHACLAYAGAGGIVGAIVGLREARKTGGTPPPGAGS